MLVPPGDVDALVDAVVELLEDEARRRELGENGRGLAIERYSWATIAERLEAIYEGGGMRFADAGPALALVARRDHRGRVPLRRRRAPLVARPALGGLPHGVPVGVVGVGGGCGRAQPALDHRPGRRLGGGDQVGDAAAAAAARCSCSRRSASGCWPTRCCPGGSASWRAWACSRAGWTRDRRKGLWPMLVGTVFAHRVFDLIPVLFMTCFLAAKIPGWVRTSLWILAPRAGCAVPVPSAPPGTTARPARRDGALCGGS